MLISHHWLKKFMPLKATPKEVADKITLSLVEVESLTKRGEDIILEIENKGITNRPDCFSHLGIAREVAAYFKLPLNDPLLRLEKKTLPPEKKLSFKVKVANPKLCPRYCAVLLTDLKVASSPKWLRVGVENCGIRSINNIVDVTNYVMLELGQPLHAFDYEKIEGKEIIVRKAKEQEKIVTLDGVKRTLNHNILVISDSTKPIGIAGIMGGQTTEVKKGTRAIVLESANFESINNRLSSKFLKLRTEASTRFEKGQDTNLPYPALIRAVELLKKVSEVKIASRVLDIQSEKSLPWQIKVKADWINKFLGIDLPPQKMQSILERLQLKTMIKKPFLLVTIPTFRPDLIMEADVAEEIARIYGYDKIPITLPGGETNPSKTNKMVVWKKGAKKFLASLGFTESYTYPLISRELIEKTARYYIRDHLKLLNPLTNEREYFRISLIPGVLEAVKKNTPRFESIQIFELGKTYKQTEKSKPPEEKNRLMGVITGESKFYEAKGVVEALLQELGIKNYRFQPLNPSRYTLNPKLWHPTRSAEINYQSAPRKIPTPSGSRDGHVVPKNSALYVAKIGTMGEIHPQILSKFGIEERVAAFDLDFDQLVKLATTEKTYRPIPKYPPIIEDLSIKVDSRVLTVDLIEAIKSTSKLITKVELIDIFKNSRTFRITYQAEDHTLTDRSVKKIREKVKSKLSRKFKAVIREINEE
jgi:phenylalanyl-tRNA synthetase beta chain